VTLSLEDGVAEKRIHLCHLSDVTGINDEGHLKLEGYRAMGDVQSHIERGVAYKINGQYDEALAELRQAVQLAPNNAEAHHQLGLVLGFIGEFEQSLAELERAVQIDGRNVVIRNDLALTYAMLGMYEEAKAQFEEVLRQDPTNEVALKQIQFLQF
jgi:tetratricopeptide (TPR) repeat protein